MRTKIATFAVIATLSNVLVAQQPGIISGPDVGDPSAPEPDMAKALPMPEEAVIKYGIGNAPFYVNLKSYVYRAQSALRNDESFLVESESSELQMSRDEFNQLITTLALYRKQENDDLRSRLLEACTPYLRGGLLNDEYARQAIASLDDSDARNRVLVEGVMATVAADFGQSVADRVRARIDSHGQSVDYSKVDLVKFIALGQGAGAGAYLKTQCDAL